MAKNQVHYCGKKVEVTIEMWYNIIMNCKIWMTYSPVMKDVNNSN